MKHKGLVITVLALVVVQLLLFCGYIVEFVLDNYNMKYPFVAVPNAQTALKMSKALLNSTEALGENFTDDKTFTIYKMIRYGRILWVVSVDGDENRLGIVIMERNGEILDWNTYKWIDKWVGVG